MTSGKSQKIYLVLTFIIIAILAFILGSILTYLLTASYRQSNNQTISTNQTTDDTINSKIPTSFSISDSQINLTSEQALSKFGYKAEITSPNSSQSYFSLILTNATRSEVIYKWDILNGLGFGGSGCSNNIIYSPDGSYFIACGESAVGVDHDSIPLIFDNNGNLIADFSNIADFISKKATDPAGKSFLYTAGSYAIGWTDNNNLILLTSPYSNTVGKIYLWKYTIGNTSMSAMGSWTIPQNSSLRKIDIINANLYRITYLANVDNEIKTIDLSTNNFST